MSTKLLIDDQKIDFKKVADIAFRRVKFSSVEISSSCQAKVRKSQAKLFELLEKKIPIYGVTTGFGDSSFRVVDASQSELLQANLISYLLCGTGPALPIEASRAILMLRLKSLSRGFSGVSLDLLERMKMFLERDWIPVIPREGSLGASGDLIPLAYVARALQGEGELWINGTQTSTAEVLKNADVGTYVLKPKEGLALVNGTTAMAGLFLFNLNNSRFLAELACLSTSWLCLALKGRTEAFGVLVNEKAKAHPGQALTARAITSLLGDEDYQSKPLEQIAIKASQTQEAVQDKYSLRCTPQVLGPVLDTIEQLREWLELEMNGTSDNPLVDEDGTLAMGGNFYGGYLSQGMDYLKISLAHVADLVDRQLMTLIDEKSNRGLPANLADWNSIPESERFLHHGLKGLHQATNAITSEIMARATPNGIFSRSSESHNQDKVSLGMSAAVQCSQMIEPLFTIQAMYLTCLAQALDLRKIELKGERSKFFYKLVRSVVPFVSRDQSLGAEIKALAEKLKQLAHERGEMGILYEETRRDHHRRRPGRQHGSSLSRESRV